MDKVVELVGGGSVINGAYPVYFLKRSVCKTTNCLPALCGRTAIPSTEDCLQNC